MADKQDLLRIKRKLREDKRVEKLDRAFRDLPEFNLPMRDIYEEIKTIHALRKTRTLNKGSSTFTQDIVEALLDDQAYRARLTEIMIMTVKAIRNLEDTLDSLEGYLMVQYGAELSTIRTKGEREKFIEHHVLTKFSRYMDNAQQLKESAELVIVDIDKAGFMFKALIEAVKLATGRKEIL